MLAATLACGCGGAAPVASGPAAAPFVAAPAASASDRSASGSASANAAESTSPGAGPAQPVQAVSDEPGWLGVELAEAPDGGSGVLIQSVLRGSPAERGGVQAGDVVTQIEGASVGKPAELRGHVMRARAGARVGLGVLRGEQTRLLSVTLEAPPDEDSMMRKSYVGALAPDFGALDTVQGSLTPSLPALRGRVVVVEFWASWCNVCHLMAPLLNEWNDRYSAQGLTVLGVTTDPVAMATRTASELGMGYALASDGSGEMLRAYRAFALPTLFVIDKHGKVRDVLIGYSTPRLRELEALVQRLIGEA